VIFGDTCSGFINVSQDRNSGKKERQKESRKKGNSSREDKGEKNTNGICEKFSMSCLVIRFSSPFLLIHDDICRCRKGKNNLYRLKIRLLERRNPPPQTKYEVEIVRSFESGKVVNLSPAQVSWEYRYSTLTFAGVLSL